MSKKQYIILCGEIVSNCVKINTCFDSLCKISPIIAKNFIEIIDKINYLDKAVSIEGCEFINCNSLKIKFSNDTVSGNAFLSYILNKNNQLELAEYDLKLADEEKEDAVQEIQEEYVQEETSETIIETEEKDILKEEVQTEIIQEEVINTNFSENEEIISENIVNAENGEFVEQKNTDSKEEVSQSLLQTAELVNLMVDKLSEINSAPQQEAVEQIIETSNKTQDVSDNIQEEIITSEKSDLEQQINPHDNIDNLNTDNNSTTNNEITFETEEIKEEDQQDFKENESEINNQVQTLEEQEKFSDNITNEQKTITENELLEKDTNIENSKEEISADIEAIETSAEEVAEIIQEENEDILDSEILAQTSEEEEEIIENNEDTIENDYQKLSVFENVNNEVSDCLNIIPKFSYDEESESNTEDSISSNEKLSELLNKLMQKLNTAENTESENQKNSTRHKSQAKGTKEEKIAMYQQLFNGYDQKLTIKKINQLKEKIRDNHAEDITSDEVLDAQIDLLTDDNSKAFRILTSNEKNDVLQLDDNLFLTKDKIYCWGDTLYLEE